MTEPAAAPVAPAQTTTLLEIAGLDAFYGKARVLDDLSFTMERGSLAIVGRNGMGKTTLCNAIMGIAPPHAMGSIRFEGQELVGGQSHRIARRGIGYVPQGRALFAGMSVRHNLELGRLKRQTGAGTAWTDDKILTFFPRLAQRMDTPADYLSGGEQQMVAVARGLMADPKVLMLDELSLGLAPRLVLDLFESLRRLKAEGLTMLLVEQNVAMAMAVPPRKTYLSGKRRPRPSPRDLGPMASRGSALDLGERLQAVRPVSSSP